MIASNGNPVAMILGPTEYSESEIDYNTSSYDNPVEDVQIPNPSVLVPMNRSVPLIAANLDISGF